MEGEEKIKALAEELEHRVGQRTLSAPVSYFQALEKMSELALDRITIPFEELHELLVEAGIPKYNVRFALRFWHRLGRCIWLEKHHKLPVVINVEKASRIFGHVICSGDRQALRELG